MFDALLQLSERRAVIRSHVYPVLLQLLEKSEITESL